MAIIERFEDEGQLSFNTCAQAMSWALVHDLPELLTGDVPTTAKDYIDLELLERELCPLYDDLRQKIDGSLVKVIVKAADFIDAIQFAEKFCVDTRKNEILHDIRENLSEYLSKDSNVLVAGAVEKLGF
jgi:5'-deoxynucleotidase YfbR-like HD superfamily hydrolase